MLMTRLIELPWLSFRFGRSFLAGRQKGKHSVI